MIGITVTGNRVETSQVVHRLRAVLDTTEVCGPIPSVDGTPTVRWFLQATVPMNTGHRDGEDR